MDEKNGAKVVLGGAAAWAVIAGLALIQWWPIVSGSSTQWLLFVVLAPPGYVLADAALGWVFSEKHGRSISRQKFSMVRALLAYVLILGVFLLGWWMVGLFK